MKITRQFAQNFADNWLHAWNNKNIESIMSHYDDNVIFSSPFIIKSQVSCTGTIKGKTELRKYFEKALEKNPDLHFDLKHIMVGTKSITLIYIRKQTMLASEVMIMNDEGVIAEGLSHYPVDDIFELL